MQESGNSDRVSARRFTTGPEELKLTIDAYRTRSAYEEVTQLRSIGGLEGLQKQLGVSFATGLTGEDFEERTAQFGHNQREAVRRKSF